MDYIKLLRLPNLAFIAAIQLLMYFCVLTPVLGVYGITPSMSVTELLLLVVSSVFIAGGGYVINDYFDMKIDEINHPITRVVGKTLTIRPDDGLLSDCFRDRDVCRSVTLFHGSVIPIYLSM